MLPRIIRHLHHPQLAVLHRLPDGVQPHDVAAATLKVMQKGGQGLEVVVAERLRLSEVGDGAVVVVVQAVDEVDQPVQIHVG